MLKTSRGADERLLTAVRLRTAGMKLDAVAALSGMTAVEVRQRTDRVRRADLDESGEPPEAVQAHYWGGR